MNRLIVLRGKPTSGKSTAFHALIKDARMQNFIFIDHPAIKEQLGKEKGKDELFVKLKEAMKTSKDIITEETSRETLEKYMGNEIKSCGYKLIIFQFEVSMETAKKRNVKRARDKWHDLMTRDELESLHKMHEEKQDKNAILVDTDKLNPSQVIEFIISKLK